MTDEDMNALNDPQFTENMAQATVYASAAIDGDDAVYAWLGRQWIAAIVALPGLAAAGTSYPLLQHMGSVALAVQRLVPDECGPFLATAAGMMHAYHLIYNIPEPDQVQPGDSIH